MSQHLPDDIFPLIAYYPPMVAVLRRTCKRFGGIVARPGCIVTICGAQYPLSPTLLSPLKMEVYYGPFVKMKFRTDAGALSVRSHVRVFGDDRETAELVGQLLIAKWFTLIDPSAFIPVKVYTEIKTLLPCARMDTQIGVYDVECPEDVYPNEDRGNFYRYFVLRSRPAAAIRFLCGLLHDHPGEHIRELLQ